MCQTQNLNYVTRINFAAHINYSTRRKTANKTTSMHCYSYMEWYCLHNLRGQTYTLPWIKGQLYGLQTTAGLESNLVLSLNIGRTTIYYLTHLTEAYKDVCTKVTIKSKCMYFSNTWVMFKGYLYYKTITSQNVLSKAQVNNFFI